MSGYRGLVFDLDGVLVDTARYHYLAWTRLARELGFSFSLADNERLKGVSRMASLEILLSLGGISVSAAEKEKLAARKNAWYQERCAAMGPSEILPGVAQFLASSRRIGLALAVASASRNAMTILRATALLPVFDAVVDGHIVTRAKPAPDVFLRAAQMLSLPAAACVVFEDAAAGIEAARAAGAACVGIGSAETLGAADVVLPGLAGIDPRGLLDRIGSRAKQTPT
jgi:beta-phosphoglucomutase